MQRGHRNEKGVFEAPQLYPVNSLPSTGNVRRSNEPQDGQLPRVLIRCPIFRHVPSVPSSGREPILNCRSAPATRARSSGGNRSGGLISHVHGLGRWFVATVQTAYAPCQQGKRDDSHGPNYQHVQDCSHTSSIRVPTAIAVEDKVPRTRSVLHKQWAKADGGERPHHL